MYVCIVADCEIRSRHFFITIIVRVILATELERLFNYAFNELLGMILPRGLTRSIALSHTILIF